MNRALLKYVLILSMGINLGNSMENSIDDKQIEGKKEVLFSVTKEASIIHEQSKQNDVINTTPEDITMQLNSEVDNTIDQKNQINPINEKQNVLTKQQENLCSNIPETKENIATTDMKLLCQIKEAKSLELIWQDIDKFVDENTLVVLDIDQTILKAMEVTIEQQYKNQWAKVEAVFTAKYPEYAKRREFYIDIFLRDRKEILTDDIWKAFINSLKSRGAKVLIATAIQNEYMLDGHQEQTETMLIELRHKQLNDALDKQEETITKVFDGELSSFWLKDPFQSPYYFKGILATQPLDKDYAVLELLEYWNNWKLQKLIVIDDQTYNLHAFTRLGFHLNAPFMGYKFTGADYMPCKYGFDPRRAFFQQLYLVKNNKWLSDEPAENALKQCTNAENKELDDLMKLYNKEQKCNKKNKKSKKSNAVKSKDN